MSNTDHKFAGTVFSGRHICSKLLMQQNRAAVLPETALRELIPHTIRGETRSQGVPDVNFLSPAWG